MPFEIKRKLKKLSDKQFAKDIKKYLRSPYEFYGVRVPELRILAKKLYDENNLNDFYKVFTKLWYSKYHEERSLAIYALQLYEKEFNLKTWNFIKGKLKDIKTWDQIDILSTGILGKILLKHPKLEKELLVLSKNKDIWIKRASIVSTLPLVKTGKIKLTMKIISNEIRNENHYIQKAIGWLLRESGKQKPKEIENFILKNLDMPAITFSYATEQMKKLRKLRKLRKKHLFQKKKLL